VAKIMALVETARSLFLGRTFDDPEVTDWFAQHMVELALSDPEVAAFTGIGRTEH
jgi:hypothetical protein